MKPKRKKKKKKKIFLKLILLAKVFIGFLLVCCFKYNLLKGGVWWHLLQLLVVHAIGVGRVVLCHDVALILGNRVGLTGVDVVVVVASAGCPMVCVVVAGQ